MHLDRRRHSSVLSTLWGVHVVWVVIPGCQVREFGRSMERLRKRAECPQFPDATNAPQYGSLLCTESPSSDCDSKTLRTASGWPTADMTLVDFRRSRDHAALHSTQLRVSCLLRPWQSRDFGRLTAYTDKPE